tara:strand:- start:6323 stop:6946 length:624 start_codon:yes stop_codon:yes gene_type:complete
MKNQINYIAYAMDFASYLISKSNCAIDRIILHGSITRGDFDEKSDVDLFIDTKESNDKKIQKIYQAYQKTKRKQEWNLKDIDFPISMIVGSLDSQEWKDLKRAMMNTGILLYGKFKAEADNVNQYILISIENIKPESRRVSIHRKLFGFTTRNKFYKGLVKEYNGKKINKGTFIVPTQHFQKIKSYLQKNKISGKYIDFWTDTDILK